MYMFFFFIFYLPRYKVAVTKHKDAEQSCGSLYNQNGIWDPAVDFSKYIEDNENITNEVCVDVAVQTNDCILMVTSCLLLLMF